MEKVFFEAFPNLKLDGMLKDLFEQVVVERITATKRKDLLRIYIRSERLIEKEKIYLVESEIKKQFFPQNYIHIKLYEKFGFEIVNIRKNYYQDEDGIMMEKVLK